MYKIKIKVKEIKNGSLPNTALFTHRKEALVIGLELREFMKLTTKL